MGRPFSFSLWSGCVRLRREPIHRLANAYISEYRVTGRLEVLQRPRMAYWVFPMDLPSDDKHNMQLDPKYTPQPIVNNRLASAFHLPIDVNIAYGSSSFMPLVPYLTVLFQLLSTPRRRKAPAYIGRSSQNDDLS
jgi:hypothetical protein